MIFSPDAVMATGLDFGGYDAIRRSSLQKKTLVSLFVSFYGHGPTTLAKVFSDLSSSGVMKKRPNISDFLLMANWLKEGITFNSLGGKFKIHPDTAMDKCWEYVRAVSELYSKKIHFGPWNDDTMLVFTVDGTHYKIHEPRTDPSSKWYSHKFNAPGLGYELAICTRENRICWTSGPFPASKHDITIYREGLMKLVPKGRWGIGDSGYSGEPSTLTIIRKSDSDEVKKFKEAARARHENVNGRLKEFALLDQTWRYHRDKHIYVFRAIVVFTQYNMETDRPLFDLY